VLALESAAVGVAAAGAAGAAAAVILAVVAVLAVPAVLAGKTVLVLVSFRRKFPLPWVELLSPSMIRLAAGLQEGRAWLTAYKLAWYGFKRCSL